MNIIFTPVMLTIIFFASLKLEAETTGKESISYRRFKKLGALGLICGWVGLVVIYLVEFVVYLSSL